VIDRLAAWMLVAVAQGNGAVSIKLISPSTNSGDERTVSTFASTTSVVRPWSADQHYRDAIVSEAESSACTAIDPHALHAQ